MNKTEGTITAEQKPFDEALKILADIIAQKYIGDKASFQDLVPGPSRESKRDTKISDMNVSEEKRNAPRIS